MVVLEGNFGAGRRIVRAIRRLGLAVGLAYGCAEAIDLCATAEPLMLVVDTTLPGWLDVVTTVQAAFGAALPIMLTGPPEGPRVVREAACRRGYFGKPIDAAALASAVATELAADLPGARGPARSGWSGARTPR